MDKIARLREKIIDEQILDGETTHHEFASGLHGRKLDMDKIATGSGTYDLWIGALIGYIRENYDPLPDVVIGVANGANRLAISVAAHLGNSAIGLTTIKESSTSVMFGPEAKQTLGVSQPEFALILEDVGTSGGTALTAAQKALMAGVRRVEVLNTWQRSERLAKLDDAGIPYHTLIYEPLPNYPRDNCDYCRQGSLLIKHD